MNNILEIYNLSKNYNTTKALNNLTFNVKEGSFVALVGPTGSGKSTLLNIISGIDKDYQGTIKILTDANNIGYMLQQDALLPWLNIIDNASIGLKFKKIKNNNYPLKLLKKYDLNNFIYKYPNELSGGMKQRCALIRTLSLNPTLLLLDEPFSQLDYQTRLMVENDIYKIIKKEKKTAIIVTHDIEEAIAMADTVITLSKRPATIKNIYHIELVNKDTPLNNRRDPNFNKYFNLIWKDLIDE